MKAVDYTRRVAPTYEVLVNPAWDRLASRSAIVRSPSSGDYHVPHYTTPLSLKSVTRGVARYHTPRTRYRLEAGAVVTLNPGQTYGMDLAAGDRTATLCVFFERGLVESVATALAGDERAMLEPRAARSLEIAERLHAAPAEMTALLRRVAFAVDQRRASSAWLTEQVMALAREIVILDGRARRDVLDVPALRASTRDELHRRLHWARDYIDASFTEPLTVAEIARVACMSAFHFHRLFKQVFGETPMHRVQRLRLECAARLLASTDLDVTTICGDVGFASLGSFSALFARRFGASPRRYRQIRRIGEVAAAHRR
jgi:AraC-like DNA-binding protein